MNAIPGRVFNKRLIGVKKWAAGLYGFTDIF